MKNLIISIYMLVMGCLVCYYFLLNQDIDKLEEEINYLVNDSNYMDIIHELESEYNTLIASINDYSDNDVDSIDDILFVENELKEKYDNKKTINDELNMTKSSLDEQHGVFLNKYNQLVVEDTKRNSFIISGVSKINQYSIGYPTGCESVALTILLNYWGVNVSVSDVVRVLPKGSKPYFENGIKYGGNPYIEFIGNPSDPYSYGVYDIPIEDVANHFKSGIINGRGMSLDEVLAVVRENRPVVVWSSMGLSVPYYSNSWIYKPTNEKINWLANLHAIVVIGYNTNQVITTDSLTGTVRYFDKATFESRYNAFGKRALYY